jgi:predicted RNase H-like HicB family nuclease
MSHHSIFVRAVWDDQANVWVATSEDVPGLVAEAETVEALRAKVTVMVEELIHLNGGDFDLPEIPLHIFTEQTSRITNPRGLG